MASPATRRMALAEFLDWDDGTDTRYELVDGEVVAMAPPTPAHAAVVINLARTIGNQLTPPCAAFAGAGVIRPDRADVYFQPDIVVTCAPLDPSAHHIHEPRLIIEVLSPTTRQHDRDLKLDGHRAIPSVHELLLVWSDQRRAQLWRRDAARWIVEDFIADARFRLESIDVSLVLASVYDNVALEEPPETGKPAG